MSLPFILLEELHETVLPIITPCTEDLFSRARFTTSEKGDCRLPPIAFMVHKSSQIGRFQVPHKR